jgi:hypothetical protein
VCAQNRQSDKFAGIALAMGIYRFSRTLIVAFDKVIPAIKDGAAPDVEPLCET